LSKLISYSQFNVRSVLRMTRKGLALGEGRDIHHKWVCGALSRQLFL